MILNLYTYILVQATVLLGTNFESGVCLLKIPEYEQDTLFETTGIRQLILKTKSHTKYNLRKPQIMFESIRAVAS